MGAQSSDRPLYPMGVAERLTGLTAQRVRYYEKVGLISPARSKGNHRLYTESELARFKEIRRLMDGRLTTHGPAAAEGEEES
ncbi:MAG: MerR family transcriptional regulator [Chitinophagales bacterium]